MNNKRRTTSKREREKANLNLKQRVFANVIILYITRAGSWHYPAHFYLRKTTDERREMKQEKEKEGKLPAAQLPAAAALPVVIRSMKEEVKIKTEKVKVEEPYFQNDRIKKEQEQESDVDVEKETTNNENSNEFSNSWSNGDWSWEVLPAKDDTGNDSAAVDDDIVEASTTTKKRKRIKEEEQQQQQQQQQRNHSSPKRGAKKKANTNKKVEVGVVARCSIMPSSSSSSWCGVGNVTGSADVRTLNIVTPNTKNTTTEDDDGGGRHQRRHQQQQQNANDQVGKSNESVHNGTYVSSSFHLTASTSSLPTAKRKLEFTTTVDNISDDNIERDDCDIDSYDDCDADPDWNPNFFSEDNDDDENDKNRNVDDEDEQSENTAASVAVISNTNNKKEKKTLSSSSSTTTSSASVQSVLVFGRGSTRSAHLQVSQVKFLNYMKNLHTKRNNTNPSSSWSLLKVLYDRYRHTNTHNNNNDNEHSSCGCSSLTKDELIQLAEPIYGNVMINSKGFGPWKSMKQTLEAHQLVSRSLPSSSTTKKRQVLHKKKTGSASSNNEEICSLENNNDDNSVQSNRKYLFSLTKEGVLFCQKLFVSPSSKKVKAVAMATNSRDNNDPNDNNNNKETFTTMDAGNKNSSSMKPSLSSSSPIMNNNRKKSSMITSFFSPVRKKSKDLN